MERTCTKRAMSFRPPVALPMMWCQFSCCGSIFLVGATRNDLQRIIGQRPVKHFCLVPWRTHPGIVLFVRGQDHRHRFRMDWFDDRIRGSRQKAVDEVGAGDRFGLGPTVTSELGPDAGERKQRPVLIERKPNYVLFAGLWVRIR